MASSKNLIIVAVILAIAAVSVNAGDLRYGRKKLNQQHACYGDVQLPAQSEVVLRALRTCVVPNPRQFINLIEVRDLGFRGRGGYAHIRNGGIDSKTVTVEMWSQPGQPLNFRIDVYATIDY